MKPARQRIAIISIILCGLVLICIQGYFLGKLGQYITNEYTKEMFWLWALLVNVMYIIGVELLIIPGVLCLISWILTGEFGSIFEVSIFRKINNTFTTDWEKIKRKQVKLDIKSKEAKERGQLSFSD